VRHVAPGPETIDCCGYRQRNLRISLPDRRRGSIPGARVRRARRGVWDDGGYQYGAWRVYYVRRVRHRDGCSRRIAAPVGHCRRQPGDRSDRSNYRATSDLKTLRSTARHHCCHLGNQSHFQPGYLNPARIQFSRRRDTSGQLYRRCL